MQIIGESAATAYIGTDMVQRVYKGSELVYSASTEHDYSQDCLTIEIISGGTFNVTNGSGLTYSINDGAWATINSTPYSIQTNSEDKIRFAEETNTSRYNLFSGNTIPFNVYGNINSLKFGSEFDPERRDFNKWVQSMFYNATGLVSAKNFILPMSAITSDNVTKNMFYGCTSLTEAPELPATTLTSQCYEHMFQGCTSLTTAPELPATVLSNYCYQYMFQGCTSLTTAPELPATTLTNSCYYGMFYNCSSLTTAPELPATTLGTNCYTYMFYGCTSLTTAPELPATVLSNYCYYGMFNNCSSLTTAPELPATTLGTNCYSYMFYGCTSLTTAPELPATTLASECYYGMFGGCSNLNYIKCLATDLDSSNCTTNWVMSVQTTSGTFVKDPNTTWPTGNNGIPSGWTVIDNV